MKNSLLATLIAGIVIILLFTVSCNKKDISIINSSDNASKEMILSYLNEQKILDLNASSFIDTLISKSDWNRIQKTSISKDVTIIYVPLNYNRNRIGMTFLYNNNTQSIYYSLITETPLSLSSISPTKNPILNKPSDIILSKDAIRPIDVIAGFYKYNMNGYTGSIKAFSLSNSFLWEYGYQNGNRKYERLITNSNIEFESNKTSPKQSYSVGSNKVKLSGCVWSYLVTYYNDGSQDWDLIGLKCDNGNDCQTTIGISEGSDIIKSDCSGKPNGPGGGSGNGDEFDKIINNITDPCLKALIINLQNANKLSNSIGGILVNVFGKNDKYNLTFLQDDNLKNDKNQTLYGQSRPLGNGNYEIKLNAKELSSFSQERQTLTIMHEVLHSYFRLLYDSQSDLNGHTRMLTNYIEQMACSLEGLFPNLIGHHDVAIALCFDNLKSSQGYDDTKDINPKVFESTLNNYNEIGLNLNTFQSIANQAKYKDDRSPIGTKSICPNSNTNNND